MIQGLPANAPLWRSDSWTRSDEMMATFIEIVDVWCRVIFSALGGKPRGTPIKILRPGEAEKTLPSAGSAKRLRLDNMKEIAKFFSKTG